MYLLSTTPVSLEGDIFFVWSCALSTVFHHNNNRPVTLNKVNLFKLFTLVNYRYAACYMSLPNQLLPGGKEINLKMMVGVKKIILQLTGKNG